MTTYEINKSGQVVPYTSGRQCTDTRSWRDATELELAQRDEIAALAAKNAKLLHALDGMIHVHEHNLSGDAAGPFVADAYELLSA